MIPKVSLNEARLTFKAYLEGSNIEYAIPENRRAAWFYNAHFEARTEYALRNRITKLLDFLGHPDFLSKMVFQFRDALLMKTPSSKEGFLQPSSSLIKFEIGPLVEDLYLDRYYKELVPLANVDVRLLHIHELFELFDKLESLRRHFELSLRLGSPERRNIVSSNI